MSPKYNKELLAMGAILCIILGVTLSTMLDIWFCWLAFMCGAFMGYFFTISYNLGPRRWVIGVPWLLLLVGYLYSLLFLTPSEVTPMAIAGLVGSLGGYAKGRFDRFKHGAAWDQEEAEVNKRIEAEILENARKIEWERKKALDRAHQNGIRALQDLRAINTEDYLKKLKQMIAKAERHCSRLHCPDEEFRKEYTERLLGPLRKKLIELDGNMQA